MSTAFQDGNEIEDTGVSSVLVPVTRIAIVLWERRWLVLSVGAAGLIVSLLVSLLIHDKYRSSASLMPPEAQALTSQSALSGLNGPSISLGGSSLTSQRTPGSTAIGILKSRTAQDDLIDRFDLLNVYHVKLHEQAREKLTENSNFDEDRKSGIVTIDVTDRDKARARDLAQAYIEELNKLLIEVNSSSARQERVFLENRLQSLKSQLDQTSDELSKFSSKNSTLNPQAQGQALFESAAKLQGELDVAQADLSGLRTSFSDDNVRVRAARARVESLQSELQKMGGAPGNASGTEAPGQVYPSIRELPLLGVTYANLYREMMIQQTVYETLTKQYEIAKVEEAKELPAAKELDRPVLAEKHASPHRSLITIAGGIVAALLTIFYIAGKAYWELLEKTYDVKSFFLSLRDAKTLNATTK